MNHILPESVSKVTINSKYNRREMKQVRGNATSNI